MVVSRVGALVFHRRSCLTWVVVKITVPIWVPEVLGAVV